MFRLFFFAILLLPVAVYGQAGEPSVELVIASGVEDRIPAQSDDAMFSGDSASTRVANLIVRLSTERG